MLGLEKGIVRLAQPSATWVEAYEEERQRLSLALHSLSPRIEHVGSTSIPGLVAKPIVDLAVQVPADVTIDTTVDLLTPTGLLFMGDKGKDGGLLFVRESAPGFRTHHVHVVFEGDGLLPIYLAFRDRLRSDPGLRERYAALKQRLRKAHADDRESYTAGKASFIAQALR